MGLQVDVLSGGWPALLNVDARRGQPEDRQPVRIGIRQPPQEQRVDDADERGIGADPDGELQQMMLGCSYFFFGTMRRNSSNQSVTAMSWRPADCVSGYLKNRKRFPSGETSQLGGPGRENSNCEVPAWNV